MTKKIFFASFDKFYINPPNGKNEIQIGVNMKSFNTIMKFARNNEGTSLILNDDDKKIRSAIEADDLNMVKYLVEKIEEKKKTLVKNQMLYRACISGDKAMVKYFVEAGAKINPKKNI